MRTGRTVGLAAGGDTADQLAVRRHNLALVTAHLRTRGARSRARVAAETGLNKATVSSLVAELLQRGLVVEGAIERGAIGRPGRVVELDATRYVAIGAEVNIDYLSVLAMNLRGEPVQERRVALDTARLPPETVLRRLAETVEDLLGPLVAGGAQPVGLTLAVPGVTDDAVGVVHDAPNLGWHDLSVVETIRRHLGDPGFEIHLDNEANLAALAELDVRRPERRPQHLLLLTGAAGVGGGVVAGGRLLRGARGFAGELGHMQVERDGRGCRCGSHGCWETVVGLGALLDLATDEGDPVRDPAVDVVRRLDDLRRRAESGDRRTLLALDRVGEWLVRGCGTLVNLFNPEVLVLGGYFAAFGPWFAAQLAEGLEAHVVAPDAGGVRVELSTLGFAAAMRGGALRAGDSVLNDPTLAQLRPTPLTQQETR